MAMKMTTVVIGIDDPTQRWLEKRVRVTAHPEWGRARVTRWFPGASPGPERLRILPENERAHKVVLVSEIEVVED